MISKAAATVKDFVNSLEIPHRNGIDLPKHQDQQNDTGLALTFASKPGEFLIEPSILRHSQNTSTRETVTSTGNEVSDLPFTSSDDASPRRKIIEISSSKSTEITENTTRPRTLTAKGREYYCGVKKTAALPKDRELRTKLSSFEELVLPSHDTSKIKREITLITNEINDALQVSNE